VGGAGRPSHPSRLGHLASRARPRVRRYNGGSGGGRALTGCGPPGHATHSTRLDTPHTAWPAVRASGGTPPGGHGHAQEPRGGGVILRLRGHSPGGVGHVGARRPRAGGVGGRVPGRSPVASPGPQRAHSRWGQRGGWWGQRVGRSGGPERACPMPGAVLGTRWDHWTCVRSTGRPQAWGWGGACSHARGGCQLLWSPGQSGGQAVEWCAAGVSQGRDTRVRGHRACPRAGRGAHPAPNKRLQATSRSDRSAPASGSR
jgi:hypothetical protein